MTDLKIYGEIRPDDGKNGFFWRNGESWLREHGKESRLLDIAPHLERQYSRTAIERRAAALSKQQFLRLGE